MSKIYFYHSVMNAGKSSALLQAAYNYTERGMTTLLITAGIDDRYGKNKITSRIGLSSPAKVFKTETNMIDLITEDGIQYDCVFVDEAQFLTRKQVEQLTDICDLYNMPICCYGLRVDSNMNTFEGSQALFALADKLVEMKTICHCGKKANQIAKVDVNGKMVSTLTKQIDIGDNDKYISLCRKHYKELKSKN